MGTDVVSVGLRHKVRVRKPLSLIEDISNIYNANICVIYDNYDRNHGDFTVLLFDLKKESAVENLRIELPKCPYLQQITSPDVSSIIIDWGAETLSEQLWDAMCNDYGHYDISGFKENRNWEIRVFRETVDIDLFAPFRWSAFLANFNLEPEFQYSGCASMLQKYRKEIYKHVQLLGCDEVVYFADQLQGEHIFNQIDKPVNNLLNYINNRGFYEETEKAAKLSKINEAHQFSKFNIDLVIDAEHKSKIIDVPDFIMNKREIISNDVYIDVLFDDFRDLLSMQNPCIANGTHTTV